MASKEIFLKGKVKWVHTNKPDPKFGKYSCVLYPDEESLSKIKELKDGKPSILNVLKKDEDGYNMKFSCDPNKNIMGRIQVFEVTVLDKDNRPFTGLVGNGSDATIKLEHYTFRKGEGAAVRLKAIRIDHLIPYEPKRDFTDEQRESTSGLPEQPVPLF